MVNMASRAAMPGCEVRYDAGGGSGSPVLFLHGAGADHVMFDQQVDAIRATGRQVVTWDMRAHGLSRPNRVEITGPQLVADAETLVQTLGLDRPTLVGHSLGGNIAQELVRRRPGGYSALVVIDSTWNAGPLGWWERQLLRLAAPGLRVIPAASLPRVMARASAVTPAAQADLRRAFSQVPKKDFLAIWAATTSFIAPDASHRTPIPLLLIRGERDRTGNIAKAMPAWAAREGIREVLIPGAGHVPSQDAPDAVTHAISRFLASEEVTR
jgi:3-oxoadipate enol-lactonase